ncbi:hypothetical protein [Halomonas organivorans]|uniref:Uncharacterized protein n=1 Tax=Halomonas organivorans TaxID=257772 RepID=A0A7W5C0N7_9GAMM|nr:hypothetical protein [Halomonas organivorans]MBB3142589.1 hypothetical protein [Halomonas organivorans]
MKKIGIFLVAFFMAMEVPAMDQETKYHFGVHWSVNGFPSSLGVQDIMLNFTGSHSHLDTRLPITQYIKQGENTVNLDSWPLEYQSEDELHVSLLYWLPGDNPNTEAQTAFEVVMRPGQEQAVAEVVSRDPDAPLQPRKEGIRFHRYEEYDSLKVRFVNRQPMPTWCWEEGDVLRDNEATRDSLTQAYRRIYKLFQAGDNNALMDASATMIQELAKASGESEAYVRQRASFDMFFDKPDVFQLDSFPEDPMTLNLAADNRVAWLTREGVAVPIRFEHVGNESHVSNVRLYFIRRNGQWEICR